MKNLLEKFWEDNKEQLFEAGKAAVRYLVFLVVDWLIIYVGALPQPGIVFVFLTFLDKWLHENWKAKDKEGIRGLFPL